MRFASDAQESFTFGEYVYYHYIDFDPNPPVDHDPSINKQKFKESLDLCMVFRFG